MATERIGKFQVRRLLGEGAQSSVWLARDPDLEREVAIKTLKLIPGEEGRTDSLLSEARIVGQLRHPSIVPVYSAGSDYALPYVVYEYVEGQTLAQRLRSEGRLPNQDAVAIATAMLRALDHAHGLDVVHRDLKPSNLLLDLKGTARVSDFGIALRRFSAGETRHPLCGTPAYLAPETISEGRYGPPSDIYAVGLVLWEMLFGHRAYEGASPFEIFNRIAHHPLELPEEESDHIEPRLRNVLAKAIAHDPTERYRSAREMLDALDGSRLAAPVQAASGNGTLDFLLRRMRVTGDFPAMSTAIRQIHRVVASDKSSTQALAEQILRDYALTQKLLRLANSAFYRRAATGRISTVTRAILVLGFESVRNIAISLLLFEHLRGKPNAERLREEFLRSNLAALLGQKLARAAGIDSAEEAYIAAMFRDLGRLLALFYFPDEASAIEQRVRSDDVGEDVAATEILGMGYEALGVGVAESWGFPEELIASMRRVSMAATSQAATPRERLQRLSALAVDAARVVTEHPPEQSDEGLRRALRQHGAALDMDFETLRRGSDDALVDLADMARVLRIPLERTFLKRTQAKAPKPATDSGAATTTLPGILPSAQAEPTEPPPSTVDSAALLNAGIQDITQALIEERTLGDVLHIALETLYSALDFQRVLIAMRDGRSQQICGRLGFGADIERIKGQFLLPIGGNDLFNRVLSRDVDVMITDATESRITAHLPPWYREHIGAGGFLLLPLRLRQVPIALIYADVRQPGSMRLSEELLSLVRTLRNQVLLGIRQLA